MSEDEQVHVGKVVPNSMGPLKSLDVVGALNQLVEAARNCYLVHEEEKTKRQRLETYEVIETAKIAAAESILKQYFERAFAERQSNFEELLKRYDAAIVQGQPESAFAVLRSIVDIAQDSPLKDLANLDQIRSALNDPDQVWEL